MDPIALTRWLERYGDAWERKDTDAFTDLFTADARYYWTPFQRKIGREAIAEAFRGAVANQRATGKAVDLDGVLIVTYGPDGRCSEFREWWHGDGDPT